jgi:hypothetical protein
MGIFIRAIPRLPSDKLPIREIVPLTELAATCTSDSRGTPSVLNPNQDVVSNQFINITGSVPYLSMTKFPSTNPFAYTNQPIMEFGGTKQEDQRNIGNSPLARPISSTYRTGDSGNFEGQPYLMQGQQGLDWRAHQVGSGIMSSFNQEVSRSNPTTTQNREIGEMFYGEGEDWSDIVAG